MSAITKEEIERRSTPEPNSGCWLWMGAINTRGYGTIGRDGKNIKAHRASYEAFNGAIPEGALVRHSCDNPSCVNPEHLLIGTDGDNNSDMRKRGRAVYVNGHRVATSKLTEKEVDAVRSLSATTTRAELARQFGVSWTAINYILCGTNWRHYQGAQFEADREE